MKFFSSDAISSIFTCFAIRLSSVSQNIHIDYKYTSSDSFRAFLDYVVRPHAPMVRIILMVYIRITEKISYLRCFSIFLNTFFLYYFLIMGCYMDSNINKFKTHITNKITINPANIRYRKIIYANYVLIIM